MARKTSNRFPWGRETPGRRLRTACDKARTALEQVDAPGFHRIPERVNAAVQAVLPLVETMEFVARAGLRTRARSADTVPGADVSTAVRTVREALAALLQSSASTQSARYEALVAALNAVITLAETGIEHGIEGTGTSALDDPWQAFGARRSGAGHG